MNEVGAFWIAFILVIIIIIFILAYMVQWDKRTVKTLK
jgi:hypothetical protein